FAMRRSGVRIPLAPPQVREQQPPSREDPGGRFCVRGGGAPHRPRRERSAPRSRPAVALRWGGGTDSLPVPWWAGGAPPPAPSSAPHPSARARRDPMPAWSRRPSPRSRRPAGSRRPDRRPWQAGRPRDRRSRAPPRRRHPPRPRRSDGPRRGSRRRTEVRQGVPAACSSFGESAAAAAAGARARSSRTRARGARGSVARAMHPTTLRVGFVPGVEPIRFLRPWKSGRRGAWLELVPAPLSRQNEVLESGEVDMCFVRLPLVDEALHLVPLWEERAAVVVGTEHVLSLFDEVGPEDLEGETEIPAADADDAAERIAAAATGVGFTRV